MVDFRLRGNEESGMEFFSDIKLGVFYGVQAGAEYGVL